jgi:hypothetical protein
MFKKTPICEICGNKPATSFSHFRPGNIKGVSGWLFTCICTDETEDYYIKLADFFSSPPATVDWLAHVNEKTWVDWSDFMAMMDRFREATDSYNQV